MQVVILIGDLNKLKNNNMKAPEKIYLYPSDRAGEEYDDEWGDKPWGEGCVEYTRTDAFIEKVCDWLSKHFYDDGSYKFYDNDGMWIDADSIIDDFKNYMKGE